jgi:hypothetical protein
LEQNFPFPWCEPAPHSVSATGSLLERHLFLKAFDPDWASDADLSGFIPHVRACHASFNIWEKHVRISFCHPFAGGVVSPRHFFLPLAFDLRSDTALVVRILWQRHVQVSWISLGHGVSARSTVPQWSHPLSAM